MKKVIVYDENVCLKKYNTMGLGGMTKNFYAPKNIDDLVKFLKKNDNYFILGGGSNIIFPDEDYDGIVVSTKKLKKLKITGKTVNIEAGIMLSFMNNALLKRCYTNFVWSASIPGTLGGALKINAGCNGYAIFDDLISIKVFKDGKIKTIKKEKIEHGYRFTSLTDEVILSAEFNLIRGSSNDAMDNMKLWSEKRMRTQPIGTKNAGSTFKNPEGLSAGALIDSCGLKGYSINGASVSLIHANFIINNGKATTKDVIDLINHIKSEVKKVHNVDLEVENKIVKW